MAQRVKSLPAMLETRVQSLGREDPLEKEMGFMLLRSHGDFGEIAFIFSLSQFP